MLADNQAPAAASDAIDPSEPCPTPHQMLTEAERLADGMNEAKDMCLHVIERIATRIPKDKTSEQETSPQAADGFIATLEEYLDFLKSSSNMKAVCEYKIPNTAGFYLRHVPIRESA